MNVCVHVGVSGGGGRIGVGKMKNSFLFSKTYPIGKHYRSGCRIWSMKLAGGRVGFVLGVGRGRTGK